MSRNLSPAIELIKRFEGISLTAYLCPAGVWTIGYGTTVYYNGESVKEGDVITEEKAEQLLAFDVQFFASRISDLIKAEVNDWQFCALLSFSYNVGHGALKTSTLLRKLNVGHDLNLVADQFLRWTKADGKVLPGLVRRRSAERELFLSKTVPVEFSKLALS